MTLPEVPKPAAHLADSLPLFTEAQMLAYRDAVVEACAHECDCLEAGPIDVYASQCADAIRSMK
jgi:hypothetical protein